MKNTYYFKKKFSLFVVVMLIVGTIVGDTVFSESTVAYAEDYTYFATLDISSKGWSSYNTGLNYDLTGGTAGTIRQGAKLSVMNEKINKNGVKVAYVYSEDLKKNCYVTSKYLKKVEQIANDNNAINVRDVELEFFESESLVALDKLVNTLYASDVYDDVASLSGSTTNRAIKTFFSAIESMKSTMGMDAVATLEMDVFVAAYNGDDAKLSELEKTCKSFYKVLETEKSLLSECSKTLCKAPYWMRLMNASNVLDVTDDCNQLIIYINNVLETDIYSIQAESGKQNAKRMALKEAQEVVQASKKDYGNNPRYIYSGTPYNGTTYGRQWCVDYVQYMHEITGHDYYNGTLCGTVDNLAIAVSKYGGTMYVVCDSSYKYGKVSVRESLRTDKAYAGKINMNFQFFDETFELRPGDIIIYGNVPQYRFAHVGLCVDTYTDGSFRTIEGNTTWGSYNGQCLNEKKRSLDWSYKNSATGATNYIMGVLRPKYEGTITVEDIK